MLNNGNFCNFIELYLALNNLLPGYCIFFSTITWISVAAFTLLKRYYPRNLWLIEWIITFKGTFFISIFCFIKVVPDYCRSYGIIVKQTLLPNYKITLSHLHFPSSSIALLKLDPLFQKNIINPCTISGDSTCSKPIIVPVILHQVKKVPIGW